MMCASLHSLKKYRPLQPMDAPAAGEAMEEGEEETAKEPEEERDEGSCFLCKVGCSVSALDGILEIIGRGGGAKVRNATPFP